MCFFHVILPSIQILLGILIQNFMKMFFGVIRIFLGKLVKFSWMDQPLVVLKMTSKGDDLNNFFSIGWILILFMVDREHMKVLRKKCKFFPFFACTSACTLFLYKLEKIVFSKFWSEFCQNYQILAESS